MPILNVVGQIVTPLPGEYASLEQRFDLNVATRQALQLSVTRGAEAAVPVEAADDDLVELEYSNGLREWTTVDELHKRYAGEAASRGSSAAVTITALPPGSDTRGVPDLVLKGLKVLGIDPAGAVADKGVKAIVDYFEGKLTPGPALYRLTEQGTLGDRVTGELTRRDGPYLLLLHGTFLSIDASFHHLLTSREWADLWNTYDGQIFGFNHRTLSRSPIDNALELIEHLPPGAKLHLLTHSRGGLVGELLCLDGVTSDDLAYFDKAGRASDMADLRQLAEQLRDRHLDVARFVRVACPARGTLLASKRLDLYLSVMLNLIGLVPVLRDSVIYDFAKACILTLVKERADPQALPGLEAMIPDSPLVCMLNRAGRKSSADLAVVAGDVAAGDGVWNTLRTWASDAFYWQDHDLIVHTRAMYGGLERPPTGVYFFRSAPDMNHMNYFGNDQTRSLMYRWLTHKAGEAPEEFHSLAQVRTPVRARVRAALPDDAPLVILIPGVFASHLKAGSQRIWIDLENLAAGKLDRLALDKTGGRRPVTVKPDGIVDDNFADLIDHLSTRFRVVPFAYDWRRSLAEEVKELAETVEKALRSNRKVFLLAHGSGGLLARALMAYHRETWDMLCQRGGRLVMLGTPHHGTYAMLELLSGQADLMRMLALLDSQRDLDEICQQFRRFPGLVELLPQDRAGWQDSFVATLPRAEHAGFEQLLTESAQTWTRLDSAVDRVHMCCVDGLAAATVGDVAKGPGKVLRFFDSSAGDGFVTTELGRLKDVPTWTMDAAHGDLANRAEHFSALEDLMVDGKTAGLKPAAPLPVEPGERSEQRARLVLYPNRQEFVAAAMGGTVPKPAAAPRAVVTLTVSTLHASLEHASYPLAIGHYDGDTIVGAEAVLDNKLDDKLSQRRLMNLYPGKVGTVEVILNPQGQAAGEPKGALVIGLGDVGQITPDVVTRGVTEAALRLALAKLESPDTARTGAGAGRPISAAFSTLLIGTRGGRALSIESAVAAIVSGALLANRALNERGLLDQVCVDEVEFVEIYGDPAARTAHAVARVKQYLRLTLTGGEDIRPEQFLIQGEGGYAGEPPSDYDAGWWQRIQIKETSHSGSDPRGGELEYLLLTERARAELTLQATQRALVERLVEKTIHEPGANLDLPAALYELLLPNALKELSLESTNLLLVVDAMAAQYPWEMLAERQPGTTNVAGEPLQPLSVRAGMIRQLATGDFRPHVQAPHGKNALVIGEPLLDDPAYPALPGARKEAEAVANVLTSFQYDVTRCIQADALAIVNALYAKEYRIIHIAGHGIYRPDRPAQSGVVLGNDIYLTGAEIGQLRIVPEMVFLNCCHLGVIDADTLANHGGRPAGQRAWNKLAASVSETLIEIGVRAVVAAGWAVNDRAAARFAETLYRMMLSGDEAQFGDAVRVARKAVYDGFRTTNTWGAYHCYGDPGFLLHVGTSPTALPARRYVAQQEFIFELKNLQSRASRTTNKGWITRYKNDLRELETYLATDLPAKWRNGEMLTELGDTFAELGDFPEAILRYREALAKSGPRERVPLRTVEQLANLEARLAVQLSLQGEKGTPRTEPERWQVEDLLSKACKRLTLLLDLTPTAERYALLGSYYKRLAITRRHDKDKRNQALADAEMNYDLAQQQKDVSDTPYHRLNSLACRCLHDTDLTTQEIEAARETLTNIEAAVEQKPQAGLTFWDRIVRPDAALGRLLLNMAQGQVEHDEATILASYRREFEIGATTRERSTVLENLEFLALIQEARGRLEQTAVINRLRENLAG